MSSISSQNEFSHRQGSVTSLPDEDDQTTTASDPSMAQPPLSPLPNEHSKVANLDDIQELNVEKEYQTASIDLQTVPDINTEDSIDQHWDQLSKETLTNDQLYQNSPRSDSNDDVTTSFGFQQQQQTDQIENSPKEINPAFDYKSFIRSQKLYLDPNPEFIRKPQMITPLVYKQNIRVKFLKPPLIPLGPLIIREIRPPQPPPPPPLIIRQRPPPPLSPPPIILREKPPRAPAIMTTQVLTKTLPPFPPPPRSVIIEKLPPLPPKPRDIIIERWIPYESTTYKRKVIVQRAEELKPHPPPRNIIITYDNVEAKVIRQFERLNVTSEDPENYLARYRDSLLDTKDLLAKARELGITEDISLPHWVDQELREHLTSNSFQQTKFERRSSDGSYTSDNNTYAPTFENLINGSSSSMNYDDLNKNLFDYENNQEDLSTQLAQYGLSTESIPY